MKVLSVACFGLSVSVTFQIMFFHILLDRLGLLCGHLMGKKLFTRLTIFSLCSFNINFPFWL